LPSVSLLKLAQVAAEALPRIRASSARVRDNILRMQDLKGRKIGLSKSLNTIKNDWRRRNTWGMFLVMVCKQETSRPQLEVLLLRSPLRSKHQCCDAQ
jgi:hypothetical protein